VGVGDLSLRCTGWCVYDWTVVATLMDGFFHALHRPIAKVPSGPLTIDDDNNIP